LNKKHAVLEHIEFTSDSDYCDSSDKRKAKKRKSKKQKIKKSSKSKKNKTSKLTEKKYVAPEQTINHTGPTTIRFKESKNSVEKVITISPINAESLNSMKINKITEESRVNKYLKRSLKDSPALNNTQNNDQLLSKKCDNVNNNNAHSNVVLMKPLSPLKLQIPRNSSLTSSTTCINTKNQPYMPSVFISPTLEIVQLKPETYFQPTLEPIQIRKEEEYVIDGMFQLYLYLYYIGK